MRKVVINGDIEHKIMQANIKIDQLGTIITKQESESSKLSFEIDTLKDEIGTMKAIEGKKIDLVCA